MLEVAPPTQENRGIPYHVFPDDETITPEAYEACMQGKYEPLLACGIGAVQTFGVHLDAPTAETWKRVVAGAGRLDTFLDDSEDRADALDRFKQGINHMRGSAEEPQQPDGVDPLLVPTLRLMKNAVTTLPPQRQATLLTSAELIGDIGARKAACKDVEEYIKLLRVEGRLSGLLITEAATDEVYAQPGYELFSAWFCRAMEFGTLLDSTRDLRKDRDAELTGVDPRLTHTARLAVAVYKSAEVTFHIPVGLHAASGFLKGWGRFRASANQC